MMPLKKVVSCIFAALAITVTPVEYLKDSKITSASAQSQSNVSQTDLQASLEQLAIEARNATNDENFNKLYDVGLAYKALADLAMELGFSTERSQALSGAEKALSTIAHNTGIFSFIKQSRPARTETWSSSSDSSFGFGWSFSSGQSRTCGYSWSPGQDSAALESSTSKLLQRVLIEQGKEEAALLAAEFGRSITVDKSVFYNTISLGGRRGPNLCDLAEDFAPRLTINDIRQIAARENATLITYSVISYQDDPHFIRNLREIERSDSNGLGTVGHYTRPSELYIWVVSPTGNVSFVQQPLSSLNLESLGIECPPSIDCRPNEYSGLLTGVARVRGFATNERSTSTIQNSDAEQNKQLYELHKLLIQPVESFLQPLRPNERVIFVPQGALNFVPFAALRDAQDSSGQYLVEKHTIITAPNLRHLWLSRRKRDELDDDRQGDALVVGNPTLDLPFAAIEAENVAQVLEDQGFDIDDLLVGSDADVRRVVKRMKDARIIHLASHGTLEDSGSSELPTVSELLDVPQPLDMESIRESGVSLEEAFDVLADYYDDAYYDDILAEHGLGVISDDSPMGRLYGLYLSPLSGGSLLFANSSNDRSNALTANDILNLDLSETELVVLSACNTGRGPLTPGGIVGLPFSLSIAGVPSIVVSLWEVPDESTSDLMIAFYKNLFDNPTENPNQDKAIGLRLAMLEMLKDDENSSPSQWAAFTLVGSAD
ncbi:CHAT domain-containing protein [Leptothoe sp. EHU-05/26/07-4]